MNRPMGTTKDDHEARVSVGVNFYAGAPKSVWALVAYHFAQRVADDFTVDGARAALLAEIEALAANGIITPDQERTAKRGFAKDTGTHKPRGAKL